MTIGLVGQDPITTFTSPVNGTPNNADTVKGNDNTIKTAFNIHDADQSIHFQSSTNAARPTAPMAGNAAKWIDNDTYRIYYSDATNWHEVAYLATAGGTITGTLAVTGSVTSGVTGSGTGGQFRITTDDGVLRYLTGVSGTAAATDYEILDHANADASRFKIDHTTGLVTIPQGVTTSGILTGASLALTTAVSKIVPGATSFSIRNTADSADNLIITNAGAATIRAGLTITAGGLTVTAGAMAGPSLAVTAGLTSSGPTGAGIGYATGAGGAVTQITSRTTGVTLNKLTGAITTSSVGAIGIQSGAVFTVTNSTVAIGDTILLALRSGSSTGLAQPSIAAVAAGSFDILVYNPSTAATESGTQVINFVVIKAVSA